MALKGFVEEARKTNQLMAKLAQNNTQKNNSIIDISDGERIPQEKLEELRQSQPQGINPMLKNNMMRTNNNIITNNKPKTDFEKEYFARNQETRIINTNSRQAVDERHCNIIANVIHQSGASINANTTWQNCKHKKECGGQVYCQEFHSLCGKERCKRATR
ncbi:MAG: hypothetical protein PHX27_00545 [Candidatus ainarchaeum sp.]|nr:hypothetical protein [Candidatus ainarchaeum sp.]